MKKLTRFLLLTFLFTGLVFSGCQDALDVTFQADYTAELPVVVTPSTFKSTNGVFSVSETIDPMTNGDFATYANNIESVEIIAVSVTILSVSNAAVMSADMDVTSGTMAPAIWVYTDQPIVEGAVIPLGNDDGQLDKLSEILSAKDVFTFTVVGQTDVDDLEFTMAVSINALITANPL